jgi:hypothetical protein
MKKFVPMKAAQIVEATQAATKGLPPECDAALPKAAQSDLLQEQLRLPITAMGVDPELLTQMSQRVQSLTAQDLQDLTRRVAGLETPNALVNALTIEDIQGIEALFRDQRKQVIVTLAASLGDQGTMGQQKDVNVSCCCCTPCCTCAAADVSPFEE